MYMKTVRSPLYSCVFVELNTQFVLHTNLLKGWEREEITQGVGGGDRKKNIFIKIFSCLFNSLYKLPKSMQFCSFSNSFIKHVLSFTMAATV